MAQQKKRIYRIYIVAKNNVILDYLKDFFTENKTYRTSYFSSADNFFSNTFKKPPSLVIVEDCFLKAVSDKTAHIPIVAMIDSNVVNGIQNVIKHNIKNYVYKPFIKADLEHKIHSAITENHQRANMESRIKELEAVLDLTRIISSTLDSQEILYIIVLKISQLMPVTRCSIIRIDSVQKSALVVATFEDPNLKGIKLNLRKYPEIMEAIHSKKIVIVRDVLKSPLMKEVREIISPLGIRSIVVIPIIYQSKLIGTLFLRTSKSSHSFSDEEVRLINAFADASAIPLHNAFLFTQIENEKTRLDKLAVTDYLTGIYNIRYFYHRITEEFSRSQRYSFPVSCLMVDLDGFKDVNDKFGHKVGDIVLKEFATLLKKHSRKSDIIARYGGDEFIMLLPQTSLAGAIAEAGRIRKFINNHKFKVINKTGFTLGIGIVSYPDIKVNTHNDIILFADKALYQAKKIGMNQTAVYGSKQPKLM